MTGTRESRSGDDTEDAKKAKAAELKALQAALGAEHAVVYGYGVVGGKIDDARRTEARAAYDAHRARRTSWRGPCGTLAESPRPRRRRTHCRSR